MSGLPLTSSRAPGTRRSIGQLEVSTGGASVLREVLVAWVVSRFVFFGLAALLALFGAVHTSDLSATTVPILRSLVAWDGTYYLNIAEHGYHVGAVVGRFPDAVYFPLFPLLTKFVAPFLGGSFALAALLISNLATLAALIALAILARCAGLRAENARMAAWLTVFSPAAVALSMAYADSLLLALLACALLAAGSRRSVLAGLALAGACLARPTGILFVLPVAFALDRASMDTGDGRSRSIAARAWTLAPLLLGVGALAAFSAFEGMSLGDPLAWISGQAAWARYSLPNMLMHPVAWPALILTAYPLLALSLAIPVVLRSRFRRDLTLPAALGAIVASQRILSAARYLLVAPSIVWALAEEEPRRRRLIASLWVVTSITYALLVLSWTVGP
jgi:hypothetical protein